MPNEYVRRHVVRVQAGHGQPSRFARGLARTAVQLVLHNVCVVDRMPSQRAVDVAGYGTEILANDHAFVAV